MTAITASLLPNGKQQFFNGATPLAGGSVGMYIPGTLTPKTTWLDPNQTTPNSNPIPLDSNGCAVIYGTGQYRQRVFDSGSNLIWDQLTQDFLSLAATGQYWGGTSGGTANAQTVTTVPNFSTYAQPITITFVAGFTNTGALTINANSLGALNVYKQTASGPVALTGGEVINGNIYSIAYDGTEFQLITGSGSAIYWGGTSGGAANVQTVSTAPAFLSYAPSQYVYFIAGFSNTGATTINCNGIGAKNIYKLSSTGPVALTGGELVVGNIYQLIYDGTEFQLMNASGGIANGGTTTGSANAQVCTAGGFSLTTGAVLTFVPGFTNTGAVTLNVNSLGAKNIYKTTATGPVACTGGELIANDICMVVYDGAEFQLIGGPITNKLIQWVYNAYTTYTSGTNTIPFSNTLPTTSNGLATASVAITPTSSSNYLEIIATGNVSGSGTRPCGFLVNNSSSNALIANWSCGNSGQCNQVTIVYRMLAGTTSALTFTLYMGDSAATYYINGNSGGQIGGGGQACTILIR